MIFHRLSGARWLVLAGYPAAEAAAALAASGGDRDAALLRLYSAWTGAAASTEVDCRHEAFIFVDCMVTALANL